MLVFELKRICSQLAGNKGWAYKDLELTLPGQWISSYAHPLWLLFGSGIGRNVIPVSYLWLDRSIWRWTSTQGVQINLYTLLECRNRTLARQHKRALMSLVMPGPSSTLKKLRHDFDRVLLYHGRHQNRDKIHSEIKPQKIKQIRQLLFIGDNLK